MKKCYHIKNGGWHFRNVGSAEKIREKLKSTDLIAPVNQATNISKIEVKKENITFNTTQTNKIKLKVEFKESEESN